MKFLSSLTGFSVFCLCTQLLFADTITLKDKSKVTGKILQETDELYIIEIQVTRSIKDEKVIKKADVLSVEKISEEDKAFEQVKRQVPVPELAKSEVYASRIRQVEAFLKTDPRFKKRKVAKKILADLKAEKVIIDEGGIKYGGEMISADDYQSNAYSIDARIALERIDDAIAKQRFWLAHGRFRAFEKRFSSDLVTPKLVSKMLPVLKRLERLVNGRIASIDDEKKAAQEDLKKMAPRQRKRTEAVLKEEDRLSELRLKRQKASGWVSYNSRYKPALEVMLKQLVGEKARIQGLINRETPAKDFAKIYRESWGVLTLGTSDQKKQNLEAVKESGLPEFYLTKLRQHAGL